MTTALATPLGQAQGDDAMPRVYEEAVRRLEDLGDELGRAGWNARLQAAPGRAPCLYVQRHATAPAEHVYATPRDADGAIWFWWSWAELIAQDTTEAAGMIIRALRGDLEL
jgi:hypothetical protein